MVVYILYSSSLQKYYVGQTSDFEIRLLRHNNGDGKFTKKGIPWELVWKTEIATRAEAMKMENKIKKRGAKRFLSDISFGV